MPNLPNYYGTHWPIKSIVEPSIFGIREWVYLHTQEACMVDSTRSICVGVPCGIHIIDYLHDQGDFGNIAKHYSLRSVIGLWSIWVVEYHIFIESNWAKSLQNKKNQRFGREKPNNSKFAIFVEKKYCAYS
jgi:hypothetical protein